MMRSGSSYEDRDGALDRAEGEGGLKIIDSAISQPIALVAYCESDGDRLDVLHF